MPLFRRRPPPPRLSTDSLEYEILEAACRSIAGVPGLTCEIGVRGGGSSRLIMETCLASGDPRVHVGIDPFGNIPYARAEGQVGRLDYTNAMKTETLAALYAWCHESGADFVFLCLEDTEFFRRFADGVPVYRDRKTVVNEYALVFFDGPHTLDAVRAEVEFFAPRTPPGGAWVFDDLDTYPHMPVLDREILALGFERVEQGACKVSYRRTR